MFLREKFAWRDKNWRISGAVVLIACAPSLSYFFLPTLYAVLFYLLATLPVYPEKVLTKPMTASSGR